MTIEVRISEHFNESGQLKIALASLLASPISQAAEMITKALLSERKVFSCGVGGNAANAQYYAALMLNRYETQRPGLAAIALGTDSPMVSAIASENQFELVYSKHIAALGMEGDILLVMSTYGQERSLIEAVLSAKERAMPVVAVTGGDGGKLIEHLGEQDIHIGVPHDHGARIQETFTLILHCLCDATDCLLLGVN